MLSFNEARKIGLNACVDWIGRDFVYAHRDSASSAYGEVEGGVYCFVGVDGAPRPLRDDNVLILDSVSKFPYRASCTVDQSNGTWTFLERVRPAE